MYFVTSQTAEEYGVSEEDAEEEEDEALRILTEDGERPSISTFITHFLAPSPNDFLSSALSSIS